MQRFSPALAAAAVVLAWIAAPAQAAPLYAAPAVLSAENPSVGMELVRDRHWRHGHRRFRGHDGFGLGFALGFGAPFIGGYPYSYAYRPYAYAECPYAYRYEPGYGCVAVQPSYRAYPYRYGGPGMPLDYREN